MKRGFNVCILIIVVISVVVSSSITIFAATHTVYKTTYSAIDGVGDSSYEQIFSFAGIGTVSSSSIFGPDPNALSDYEIYLSATWDLNCLYLLAEIYGPCGSLDNPGAQWIGSGIVFGVETDSGGPVVYSMAEYSSRFQLSCIEASGMGALKPVGNYDSENLPKAYVRATATSCVYEIALEWSALGISPEEGKRVPFNIAFIFNDVPYRKENINAVQLSSGLIEGLFDENFSSSFTSELMLSPSKPGPSHTHEPDSPRIISESTCQTHGTQIIVCKICGETLSRAELPLIAHKEGEATVVKEPTEKDFGMSKTFCVMCGIEMSSFLIDPLGEEDDNNNSDNNSGDQSQTSHTHRAGRWETVSYADCVSDGEAVKRCKICSVILERKTLPATGHHPGLWKTISFPIDNEPGIRVKYCTVCGAEVDRREFSSGNGISVPGETSSSENFDSLAQNYIDAVIEINSIDEAVFPSELIERLKAAFKNFSEMIENGDEEDIAIASAEYEAAYEALMNSVVSVSDDISGSDGETVKEESQDKIFDETIFILFVVTLISAILLFTVYFVVVMLVRKRSRTKKQGRI